MLITPNKKLGDNYDNLSVRLKVREEKKEQNIKNRIWN